MYKGVEFAGRGEKDSWIRDLTEEGIEFDAKISEFELISHMR